MNAQPVRCEQLRHVYQMDGEQMIALDTIDLTLTPGSSNAIIGPSGSGKSTLVTLLAGLQRPTSGRVYLGEEEISRLPETALLRIRAEQVGVAMQNPSRNLLPYADAADNTVLNKFLWEDRMGDAPMPTPQHGVFPPPDKRASAREMGNRK